MSQDEARNDKSRLASVVIPAVCALIAAVLSAYFSYSAGINAIRIPLNATQTAEARQTKLTQSAQQVTSPVEQVAAITPTAETGMITIESLPLYVVAYENNNNSNGSSGWSPRLAVQYDSEAGTGYTVDYSLPSDGEGNAGIAFKFSEPYDQLGYDLSDYKFIEISISFGDEQASCELFMKDITDKTDAIELDNTASNLGSQNGTIQIVLSDVYDAVNLKVIKEIGCNAKTPVSRGQHTFTIRKIRFIEE